VRHLSDGVLRRLYDEPFALEEQARAHYNDCPDCQARFAAVADDARHALALMAVPGATVDPQAALRATRPRLGSRPRLAVLQGATRWRRPLIGGLAAAALAAVLAATLAFTPLASTIQTIFEPKQVSTVTVQQGDLNGLDAFSGWGDVKWTRQPELKEAGSAAEAAQISGLREIQAKLPASVANAPVTYGAVGQATGTVTFTSKAPAKLQGSTLTVQIGPAETAIYGDLARAAHAAGQKDQGGAQDPQTAIRSAGPILAIVEMRSPQVSSTGVKVSDIKRELLAQPGLSPSVRAAISAIDSPTGNLPIPVPGQINAHDVTVQGVKGTAVGDSTGLGSAVIWIKGGRVYGVAGTFTEDEIKAVANSLS
jgi:hypothetical protein